MPNIFLQRRLAGPSLAIIFNVVVLMSDAHRLELRLAQHDVAIQEEDLEFLGLRTASQSVAI